MGKSKKITLYDYCIAYNRTDLLEQWHPTKNVSLKPDVVTPQSNRKVWWRCEKGHEWEAMIYHRAGHGTGCPYCSNKAVLVGYNDLATTHPELVAQWHPAKNGDLKPEQVMAGSSKKVWWQCGTCGHEWSASLVHRTREGSGCPRCSHASAGLSVGVNDLATIRPELAAQWHPTKNGDFKPSMVTASRQQKAWWQCEKGHEWQALISARSAGAGCPYCANKAVLAGYNDLATTRPELAAQWHPTKNGDLKPSMVTAGSGKKAWWQCEKGHEWEMMIRNKSREANDYCPVCGKEKRKKKKD